MKLRSVLNRIPDDEWLYIGAQNAYVCICQKKDVEDKLRRLSESYLSAYIDKRDKTVWKIKNYTEVVRQRRKRLSEAFEQNDAEKAKAAAYTIEYGEKLHRRDKRTLARVEKIIDAYVPFLEREVKDMYQRKAVSPLGTIIIVEGTEIGMYWSLDEVEDDRKERGNEKFSCHL